MDLNKTDYAWFTEKVREVANVCCDGRIISVLEGGYGCQHQSCQQKRVRTESSSSGGSRRGKRNRKKRHLSPERDSKEEHNTKKKKKKNNTKEKIVDSKTLSPIPKDTTSSCDMRTPVIERSTAVTTSSSSPSKEIDIDSLVQNTSLVRSDSPFTIEESHSPRIQLDRSRFALNVLSHIRALAGALD